MSRILRTIALAASAMAVFAVMASAAQAETGVLTAQQYPAIVTGPQVAGATFDIAAVPQKTVTCASSLDTTLNAPTDPVTFVPSYAGCVSEPGAQPVTVTLNGCDYSVGVTRPGTTGWPLETGELTASIVCPFGQQIEIHVYENGVKHGENVSQCTYDIGPQGPVQAGVYHNRFAMPRDVELTVQAKFTARSTIGPEALCGGAPPNQHLPITLTGAYTLKGYQDFGGVEGGVIPLDVG